MAWARLDDGFHDHPKLDGLSLAAVGLWTLTLTWAHRHRRAALVEGHVTEARAQKIAGRQTPKLAAELVDARLWEVEENVGGWVIHDFVDYLPKERDPAERRQAGRKGAAKRWQGDSKLPSGTVASDSSRASAPAFPSRPDPTQRPVVTPLRGSRIPKDFTITTEMAAWCRERGITKAQAEASTERFVNHWKAKTGKDATKLDWFATWRNWLLRDYPDAKPADEQPSRAAQLDREMGLT